MINEPRAFQQFSAARETVQANLSRLEKCVQEYEHGKNVDVTTLARATLPLPVSKLPKGSGRSLVQDCITGYLAYS